MFAAARCRVCLHARSTARSLSPIVRFSVSPFGFNFSVRRLSLLPPFDFLLEPLFFFVFLTAAYSCHVKKRQSCMSVCFSPFLLRLASSLLCFSFLIG